MSPAIINDCCSYYKCFQRRFRRWKHLNSIFLTLSPGMAA
jgi:hypothetical protein